MMNKGSYILIVEDSSTQAKQIELSLKPLGHTVTTACSAEEALALLKKQKALIVISDILMPDMDGYQLCKAIKTDTGLKDMPVVLLTRLSDPKEIIKGLESGADDFIVKPYSEDLLLTRIGAILSLRARPDLPDSQMNKQISILVVEDSPTQAEQLKYLLEDRGYKVLLAADGREGLDIARETRPAIVISDILMPVMNGYELAYEMKHDDGLKHIPVILITSLMDRKEVIHKAAVVADGYFTKPFDNQYLLEKIESLILTPNHHDEGLSASGIDILFGGEHYVITAGRRQALNFLLSIYENAVQQNRDLMLMQRELQALNEQLEDKVIDRTRQLDASEKNFRTLTENANDGILIINDKGKNVYANKMTSEITGFNINELLNTGMESLIHPDKRQETKEVCMKNLSGIQQQCHHETVIVRKDGRNVNIEMTCAKTMWHNKPSFMTIMRDISWRKKIEEEFIRSSKLESISVLAGGIAHDFNNLLTGIIGNISLAMAYITPDDKIYPLMSNVEKASTKAKDLTQQLLTFAKGGTPIKNIVALGSVITDSATLAFSGSHIRCNFSIPEDLCLVEVDEGQITQVIHNLVINAIQAGPRDGVINISSENCNVTDEQNLPVRSGKYVMITISDSGGGILKENLSRIFDPYFTTKDGGSGLGLATVYSIIKNHDGLITVESSAETGTTFNIYLPASQKQLKVFPIKDIGEKPLSGKGRILIMDDEEIIRDTAGSILTTLGYEVESAKNGSEAIELYMKARLEGHPFSLVIMDLTIQGGMGGRETVKKLLEMDPDVRAIVSSGYSDDALMSDYKKHGFSAVIAKPYRLSDLRNIVSTVINRPKE